MGFFDYSLLGTNYLWKKAFQLVLAFLIVFMIISVRSPMLVKGYAYSVFREISKAQMMWQTRHWEQIEGNNFIVRYKINDVDVAPMVLESAEKAYVPLQKEFAYTPKEKVLIVVYPTRESLSTSFGWASDESAMGVYWAGVIRVLSPQEWIDAKDEEDMKKVFEAKGPMAHEFAHLLVDYVTRGNYTRWFTEGIALYHEFKLNGEVEEEYRQSFRSKQLYPFYKMDKDFDALEDQSLAYRQSYEAVKFIVERNGEAKLWEILMRLSFGETMNQSFSKALGMNLNQFEEEFSTWMLYRH